MSRFVRFGGAWVDVSGGGSAPFTSLDTTDSPDTTTSRGVTLTRPASDNTPGSWTTIIAAAADSVGAFTLTVCTPLPFPATFGQRISALVDVAYGASNTVVVSGIPVSAYSGQWSVTSVCLPCDIPTGEPIKVRYQASDLAVDIDWFATLHTFGPTASAINPITMGAVTADSGGTEIDPGAAANTKGSWVEIEDSTTADFAGLVLVPSIRDANSKSTNNLSWLIDIGTGPAASETVLVGNINIVGDIPVPSPIRLPISVATGTRLAVRAQCNSTDPEDRVFDAVLIGIGA